MTKAKLFMTGGQRSLAVPNFAMVPCFCIVAGELELGDEAGA